MSCATTSMSKPLSYDPNKPLSSFGRRHGRKLTERKQKLVDEWLPELLVPLPGEGMVDLAALFPDKRAVHVEIGFGAGEHLIEKAKQNPDIGYIGCEPFINGVAALLVAMEDERIENIRLFADDARLLLQKLPSRSIEMVYILFPDPWRKPKHYKRRIVSMETLDLLAHLQPIGGKLQLATDHVNYCGWMLEKVLAHQHYEWLAECMTDWQVPPEDWVMTRYQRKTTKQGRVPTFILCERVE